jgi:hypothetical protein
LSQPRDEQVYRYLAALGTSLGIHVLLLALMAGLGIYSAASPSANPPVPDERITFTLEQRPDEEEMALLLEAPRGSPQPAAGAAPRAEVRQQAGEPEAVLPTGDTQAPVEPATPVPESGADAASPEATAVPAPQEPEGRPRDLRQAMLDVGRALADRPPGEAVSPGARRGSRHVITGDLSPLPGTGFGVHNLQFESRDFDWSDYGRQIYMAIWRAWHNRLWATSSEFEKWAHENQRWLIEHTSQVRFVIERSGQVTGIALERPAGCPPLDQSAIDALAEVILPPLPQDFPREREAVHGRFTAFGEIASMRTTLSHYKAQGLF